MGETTALNPICSRCGQRVGAIFWTINGTKGVCCVNCLTPALHPTPQGGLVERLLSQARACANQLILSASDGSESYTDYKAGKELEDALNGLAARIEALEEALAASRERNEELEDRLNTAKDV